MYSDTVCIFAERTAGSAQSSAGVFAPALTALSSALADVCGTLPPVLSVDCFEPTADEITKDNILLLGTVENNCIRKTAEKLGITLPTHSEGYSIAVDKNPANPENRIILIVGADEAGMLYGTMDFIHKYCGSYIYEHRTHPVRYDSTFEPYPPNELPEWRQESAPKTARRGIWSWGHVIYDYRRFFDHMMHLRMNEITLWNDFLPVNAADIVAYAHAHGIKVYWGYTWGWKDGCGKNVTDISDPALAALKADILDRFEREYKGTGDGIYFQSFTELNDDSIGGICIADAVVRLVNETAGELLSRYPDLQIRFGLHAISVKNQLDFISRVDPRVEIIWEDCGTIPFYYDYRPELHDYSVDFVQKIAVLRGEKERFGMVLKGMTTLDWHTFRYAEGPLVIGERSPQFCAERARSKETMWRLISETWITHADEIRRLIELMVDLTGGNMTADALIEDGMFEEKVYLPAIFCAECMWDVKRPTEELLACALHDPMLAR